VHHEVGILVGNARCELLQQGPPLQERLRITVACQVVRRHTAGKVAAADREDLHFCKHLHQQVADMQTLSHNIYIRQWLFNLVLQQVLRWEIINAREVVRQLLNSRKGW
jgi:hypothetical protein